MSDDILIVREEKDLPDWADRETLVRFFHETMEPWNDSLEDVQKGLEYCFSDAPGKGGFLTLKQIDGELAAAVLMLDTGMEGYIPENLLLMVSVDPDRRGQGIGKEIIDHRLMGVVVHRGKRPLLRRSARGGQL